MTNVKYIFLAILVTLALIIISSCSRDLDELDLATYPTTPDVFLDGFSGGLNYAAFGGSKVTAFEVDTEIKYKGASSMQFEVPDVNDPAGAYAGGSFTSTSGRDLSGYDALTFWAKASKSASIDVIGFGNDLGESKYLSTISGLNVNTNWKKYYIPIADPSKLTQEKGMLFYSEGPEEGKGYTFWIDEVQFEKLGTIAHPKPAILEKQDQVIEAETGDNLPIGGIHALFNIPSGIDQRIELAPSYFTFSASNPSVATVNEFGVASVIDSGTCVVTAKLGELDAVGSLTIDASGTAIKPPVAAPVPTRSQDSVISMYSNVYDDVLVDTWNPFWEFSTAQFSDIKIGDDDVKRYKSLNFVGILTESSPIDASAMTHFHIDIWTPNTTDFPKAFKVLLVDYGNDGSFDGGDDSSHELTFTSPTLMSETWISLDIPLSNFVGLTNRSKVAQLVLSGDLPTVFIDNVYFYQGDEQTGSNNPSLAAPVPTRNASDVISIFSDSYSNVSGTDLNPDWGQATVVSEIEIDGNNTLIYTGLNYQGTQFESSLNVTEMTHLHLDYWTANSAALNAFLISTGPIETGKALSVPTNGWASIDIPLSNFSPVDLADLIQFKFDGSGDIYLDNIYFFKGDEGSNSPTQPAPDPTQDPGDVISVFSDAYVNIDGTNLNPDWGQATIASEISISENNTLMYSGLNYQGIELGSNQDVSEMTHIHINYWTKNSTALNIFLISPGPAETPYALGVPTEGWSSLDIPLSEFSAVDLADLIQLKFDGDGDIYIDNIFFYK